MFKKIIICLLCSVAFIESAFADSNENKVDIELASESAVLMEASTGTVLYSKDANSHRAPASVTKIMTMLLVFDAIEAGTISLDTVIQVSANAASMGGSQIWLEEGEKMTVDEMLKCVAVVSANDCAVALAEKISGTEDAFVRQMNEKAQQLGMVDTNFSNCTGLFDDDEHYTSTYDMALASRALLNYKGFQNYSTIWMDSVRNGEFQLSNTNKLIKNYDGAIGLKTGFTNNAMYCLSAAAERNGTTYIAVVFHAATSQERFSDAQKLLDYAFSNFDLVSLIPEQAISPISVNLGTEGAVSLDYTGNKNIVLDKKENRELSYEIELDEEVTAPVSKGQCLGVITVKDGENIIAKLSLCAHNDVPKIKFFQLFLRCVRAAFC